MPRKQLLAAALALAPLGACSADGGGDDGPGDDPLFAIVTGVFTDTDSATYVNLERSLDIDAIEIARGREFPGYAPVAASGGRVFVASGESPAVTRYSISDAGEWIEDGTVSFANHTSVGGVTSVFIDADTAYASLEVAGRILWDPDAMAIVETRPPPPEVPLERDGLRVNLGHDHAIRGDRMYQPVYWADASYQTYSPTSQIIVYDTTTDDVVTVLDAPCPHLHIASRDAGGNVYFSNGSLSGTTPLFDEDAPANCVVRINDDEDAIDPDFTFDFADVTDGREGAGFRILDDRTAFFAVFHHEDVEITPDTDPTSVNYSADWRLWTLDRETREAAPVEGLAPFAGQYLTFPFDDRTFISFPAADYASTTTFEILADGSVVERFVSDGWTYDMVRVR